MSDFTLRWSKCVFLHLALKKLVRLSVRYLYYSFDYQCLFLHLPLELVWRTKYQERYLLWFVSYDNTIPLQIPKFNGWQELVYPIIGIFLVSRFVEFGRDGLNEKDFNVEKEEKDALVKMRKTRRHSLRVFKLMEESSFCKRNMRRASSRSLSLREWKQFEHLSQRGWRWWKKVSEAQRTLLISRI